MRSNVQYGGINIKPRINTYRGSKSSYNMYILRRSQYVLTSVTWIDPLLASTSTGSVSPLVSYQPS
jgi:hypothetical protein